MIMIDGNLDKEAHDLEHGFLKTVGMESQVLLVG